MPAVNEYGRKNARFFNEVKQAAENRTSKPIRWLVDASKDIYRLFWLMNSGYFDLRVIHLVKDPRAFTYSMVRRSLPNGRWQNFRMTGRWLVENWLFTYLSNQPALRDKTLQLRYEDLAGSPDATMNVIGQWLGLVFEHEALEAFRQIENHAIAGNSMRWQSTEIRLDEQWRHALPQDFARVTWAITGPLARSYGYER
jgi:hypothetical protein